MALAALRGDADGFNAFKPDVESSGGSFVVVAIAMITQLAEHLAKATGQDPFKLLQNYTVDSYLFGEDF